MWIIWNDEPGENVEHIAEHGLLPEDIEYVRGQILETVRLLCENPPPAERLEALKKRLRYSFALRLDNSQAIAFSAGRYIALRGTPETINMIYDLYAQLTPADIQQTARKYLTERNRTMVTLTGAPAGGAR